MKQFVIYDSREIYGIITVRNEYEALKYIEKHDMPIYRSSMNDVTITPETTSVCHLKYKEVKYISKDKSPYNKNEIHHRQGINKEDAKFIKELLRSMSK